MSTAFPNVPDTTVFESPTSFIAECDAIPRSQFETQTTFLGTTRDNAFDLAHNGWPKGVELSQPVLEAIRDRVTAPTVRRRWNRQVVGQRVDVPSYLSGDPECVYNRSFSPSDVAPVRVLVDLGCNSKITGHQLLKRGAGVLALTLALTAVRPVELWVTASIDGGNFLIRVPTQPLILAEASYVLGNVAFYRCLGQGWAHQRGFSGAYHQWVYAAGRDEATPEDLEQPGKDHYGLGPEDIYIPRLTKAAIGHICLRDPATWVLGILERRNLLN